MEKLFDAEGITSSDRLFFTPSAFARKHLCYAQEAGTLKSLKPHVTVRDGLESFLFFVVKSGSGWLRYEEKQYELRTGDAVLIDCRMHYEQESSESSPWELAWVHFDGARAEAVYPLFWKDNGESARIPLGKRLAEAEGLIGRIMEHRGENSPENELRADAVIAEILLLCTEQARCREDEEQKFEGLRETLNEKLLECKEIGAIRHALEERYGADFARIDAVFAERYGISVEGYVKSRILNKAKELLRFTIKPLEEVAAESGVGDAEKLRELFMDNEKMSPEDYRKRWAQWIKD
ncbi:MAG: helix-turn-helix transcriptional regulator [Lachnospiraceae bacterium]|nr:helix-turn-helix transcriptional regulator [Lachnospiraceae bacterium]